MVWARTRILVMESYAGVVWIPWRGWLERVEATGWVCECVVGQLVQAGSAWMLLTGGTEAGYWVLGDSTCSTTSGVWDGREGGVHRVLELRGWEKGEHPYHH